jgi:predicted ATPase
VALIDFRVSGYRSVRNVWLKLRPINVIVGANGCGKSNLYRSMYLLHCAANGRLAQALAEEGGMESISWAGKRRKHEKNALQLSVRSDKYEYNLICASTGDDIRPPEFKTDPEIKSEDVFLLKDGQRHTLLKRRRDHIEAKDADGKRIDYTLRVMHNESVLSALRDSYKFPDLFALREEFLNWRFYHHFRTDASSPMRFKQVGCLTPVLSHDGRDIAAAFESIRVAGDGAALEKALVDAFPGSEVRVETDNRSRRILQMFSEGFARPFNAQEFSDGTLQYICLVAALLSLRPPSLLALNEPEGSLHPRLFEPLARLIVQASKHSQIWLTTHSIELADHILDLSGYEPLELQNVEGETKLSGVGLGGYKEHEDSDDTEGSDDNKDSDHADVIKDSDDTRDSDDTDELDSDNSEHSKGQRVG